MLIARDNADDRCLSGMIITELRGTFTSRNID
jgi:hypothetical protein